MDLHIVIQDNPALVARGTLLDRFIEGYQEVVTKENEQGHLIATIYTGPVYRAEDLDDFVVPLPKRGKVNNAKLEKRLSHSS